MHDWNAVITVHENGYNGARQLLERYGPVAKTDFFNVLVMQAPDARQLLEKVTDETARDPKLLAHLARIMPVTLTFSFQSPAEFEEKARQAVTAWLPSLEGKSFYLRMHRRGFKGRLSSMEEERFLDTYLLDALETAGRPGSIRFENPDAVMVLETVGPRAGLSFWTREELQRYPLLHMD